MWKKLLPLAVAGLGILVALALYPSSNSARAADASDCSQCHGNVVSSFTASPVDRLTVCRTCHTSLGGPQHASVVETAYGWFASEQSPLAGPEFLHAGGVHVYKSQGNIYCDRCHATASCRACHQEVAHGQHGSSAVQPVTQVTTLGGYYNWPTEETFSCGTSKCHTTLPEVARYRPDGTDLCYNCHPVGKSGHGDLTQKHTSGFVANPAMDCSSCHQGVLTDEHLSRADAQGNPYTCATCHNSARAEVQQAIAGNQTDCDACHTIHTDLAQKHVSDTPGCGTCHRDKVTGVPVLTSIHLSGCGTCHSSTNTYVREAIAAKTTACLSCHRTGGAIHPHLVTAHESVNCQACHLEEKAVLDQSVHGASRANLQCLSCHRNLVFPDPYADSVDLGDECTKCHGNKVSMGGDKGCVPCHLNPGESFVDGNRYWGHYFKKRNNEGKSISNPK